MLRTGAVRGPRGASVYAFVRGVGGTRFERSLDCSGAQRSAARFDYTRSPRPWRGGGGVAGKMT